MERKNMVLPAYITAWGNGILSVRLKSTHQTFSYTIPKDKIDHFYSWYTESPTLDDAWMTSALVGQELFIIITTYKVVGLVQLCTGRAIGNISSSTFTVGDRVIINNVGVGVVRRISPEPYITSLYDFSFEASTLDGVLYYGYVKDLIGIEEVMDKVTPQLQTQGDEGDIIIGLEIC